MKPPARRRASVYVYRDAESLSQKHCMPWRTQFEIWNWVHRNWFCNLLPPCLSQVRQPKATFRVIIRLSPLSLKAAQDWTLAEKNACHVSCFQSSGHIATVAKHSSTQLRTHLALALSTALILCSDRVVRWGCKLPKLCSHHAAWTQESWQEK